MSIDDPDTDRNAGESGSGLVSGWLSRIKPDSGSSDPLKFAKWGGWVVAVYLLVTAVVGIYWSSKTLSGIKQNCISQGLLQLTSLFIP